MSAQRRFADAEPLYQRALAIREQRARRRSSRYSRRPLNNLASLYQAEGRTADALPLVRTE